jgi:hypothetical protein
VFAVFACIDIADVRSELGSELVEHAPCQFALLAFATEDQSKLQKIDNIPKIPTPRLPLFPELPWESTFQEVVVFCLSFAVSLSLRGKATSSTLISSLILDGLQPHAQ